MLYDGAPIRPIPAVRRFALGVPNPTAKRCYAWAVGRRVTAVLGTGPIDSAVKAVRASILAEDEGR
jgi:hypothetical protein